MNKFSVFILMLLACSCVQHSPGPEIVLGTDTVVVASAGERLLLPYSVSNPLDDGKLEVTSDCSWIDNITVISGNEFSFDVLPNGQEAERRTKLYVDCRWSKEPQTVVVIQKSRLSEAVFEFGIDDVGQNHVSYHVCPYDKEMYYISSVRSRDEYLAFGSDEERYDDDMSVFLQKAEDNGVGLADILALERRSGDSGLLVSTGLLPETDYCVYAFGISAGGELAAPYRHAEFSTSSDGMVDIVFDISCDVDGDKVRMSVSPSLADCPYVMDIYEKEGLDVSEIRDVYQEYIDEYVNRLSQQGKTVADIVKDMAYLGPDVMSVKLAGYTDYVGFAVAVDMAAKLVSEVSFKEFTTGEPGPSDNVISIEVTKVSNVSADYVVMTTNEDPYALFVKEKSYLEGMTDEEIVTQLLMEVADNVYSGVLSSRAENLAPDTEYSLLAFGCSGGVATTSLARTDFKTKSKAASDATFELLTGKYYDGTALAAIYPEFSWAKGRAVCPTEAVVNTAAVGYMYNIYSGDLTDESAVSDEEIVSKLQLDGMSDPTMVFVLAYDSVQTAVGVAYDSNWNLGVVFRKKIVLTQDGTSPVNEYPSVQ